MKSTNNVSKKDLIDLIASNNKIQKSHADEAIKMVLSGISKALSQKNNLTLIGFGTFYTTKTKARTGRNPQTGAVVKIKAATHVRFRPGLKLKEACN